MKGSDVGTLFAVNYSLVSQERKRLRERLAEDHRIEEMLRRLENRLSTIKI